MALFSSERISWLRQHQRVTHGVLALFWTFFFIVFFFLPGFFQKELREFDLHFSDLLAANGRLTPANPDMVFLSIDNASIKLDEIDPDLVMKDPVLSLMDRGWPWSHQVHAAILDRLAAAGAKVVIFDVLFLHPAPVEDVAFKASLDRYADRVIIGANYVPRHETDFASPIDLKNWSLALPSDTLLTQTAALDPRAAFVNFPTDADNAIRRIDFQLPYLGPSLGRVSSDLRVDSITARALEILGRKNRLPADGGDYWFRLTGASRASFQTYSIYRLFYPPDWKDTFKNGAYFKDKIVMVGPGGNFQQDEHRTSLGPMDGAEIHLQALNAALHGELLFYSGDSPFWLIVLVTVAGLIAWLLGIIMEQITWRRVALATVLAIALIAAYLFFGLELYSHGFIVAAAAPLGTLSFTMVTGLGGQYMLEQFERTRTRRFLERYVSPKIVREILDNPRGYLESLSGRRREMTILFSDLRSFTSMTEKADSEQLVRDLNEYFQGMTRALFQHDGILDKFIGDAVMAVWGSFQPDPPKDARNAVLAALAMHRELVTLNALRRERGSPPLAMGIGINHGEAIVGDIGSDQQMNFTVIGDSVNLASRLEGTTKEYGLGLLISGSVEELVRPFFHLQTVDSIVVKGRKQPVMTFAVHGVKEEPLPPQRVVYLGKYEEAMRLYRVEKFGEARAAFAACLELSPGDTLCEIFEERSAEFIVNPPPQPWDGSYTMQTK